MKPRWRKVLHDLIDNKARTLLVVFSIAVGVFSIGVIAGAYQIISQDMSVTYAANRPANIEIRTANFDEAVLDSVKNQPSIQYVEARRVFNIRVRETGTSTWTTLDMFAIEDFQRNSVNLLIPLVGETEPGRREILLEQRFLQEMDVTIGDRLEFQLPNGL